MRQHHTLNGLCAHEKEEVTSELTEACDTQQMLCSLSNRGRQSQVYKGLHPELINEAQPEVVLLLHWV